jgi:hypothetical protein
MNLLDYMKKRVSNLRVLTISLILLCLIVGAGFWLFTQNIIKLTGKAVEAECPHGLMVIDDVSEPVPGVGNIESIHFVRLEDQTFIDVRVVGPYSYITNQYIYLLFDSDKDILTGQQWGIVGADVKVTIGLSASLAKIEQFGADGGLINTQEVPFFFYNNSYLLLAPSGVIPSSSMFYFETSGTEGWADLGHAESLELITENYSLEEINGALVSSTDSSPINLSEIVYQNLPINRPLTLAEGVFINNPTSYISLNQSSILFQPLYQDYKGDIFRFARLDRCGILTKTTPENYIPGDIFSGKYVHFIIPGDFIPFSANSPDSSYNDTLRSLFESTGGIKIRDIGYAIQETITGVRLPGIIFIFDYNIAGGAISLNEIIKNGFAAFENNGVPEFGGDFHEIAHYHTLKNPHFTNFYPDAMYYEGFSTILAHYTKETMINNYLSYGLSEAERDLLSADNSQSVNSFECLDQLKETQNLAPFFDSGNGCIISQLVINLSVETTGDLKPVERLMKIYSPDNTQEILNIKHTSQEEHTLFVASLSAALERDVRDYFIKLGWPIDEAYYNEVLPIINSILNGNPLVSTKHVLECQRHIPYAVDWHLSPCNAANCGQDGYGACDNQRRGFLFRMYYSETCTRAESYFTECSESPSCADTELIISDNSC